MSYVGTVENGVVVLPPQTNLPEGAQVRVEPVPAAESGPSFLESIAEFGGMAKDLPTDLAENHDHSLLGHPKKK